MKRLMILTGFCFAIPFLKAQDGPAPAPQEEAVPAAAPGGRGGAPGGRGGATNEPRPYDRVITKDAKTSAGVFKVHFIRERGTDHYYYEIPPSEMGKEFLFVTQIAKNTLGAGYGGQTVGEMVGRWERRENRILLRGVNYDVTADPGDADAVYSTGLGLKNLQRVMDNLLVATTHEGQDWDDLRTVYGRVVGQWANELGHVAQIVGAFDSFEKHGDQDGVRFNLVPRNRQVAAVKFLNENAFATPTMLLRPEVLRRIEPAGALTRIRTAQLQVLNSLLSTQRFDRLVEEEAIDGVAAYRPSEFLADLPKGIFGEIYAPSVKIDAYRRNLQRAYLDLMSTRLNGAQRANDDQRPMFRGELKTIAADAGAALARTTDRDTRLHLDDLRDQIAKILDPKIQLANPPPALSILLPLSDRGDIFCFTDYAIE